MKIYGKTEDVFEDKKHTSVFVKDNSVTLIKSNMRTGRRRDNGKTWARWESEYKHIFWRNKNGTINALYQIGKRWNMPDTTYALLDVNDSRNYFDINATDLFRANVQSNFGITHFTDVFPIAKLFELNTYPYIPRTLINDFRAHDIMEFTVRVFGKTNYRKDLVRACANSNAPIIAVAKEFKNLVPIDWIIRFINESHIVRHTYGNLTGLRAILKNIDSRSYRRMIYNGMVDRDMVSLENLCSHYRGHKKREKAYNRAGQFIVQAPIHYPEEPVRSVEELHDYILNVGNGYVSYSYAPPVNTDIEKTNIAKNLHDLEFHGLRIEVPKDTDTMREWSQIMHNCIGAYVSDALDGRSTFAGIYAGDKLIANFQITNNRLLQLFGPCNQPLEEIVCGQITDKMKSLGIDVSSYWGGPGLGAEMGPVIVDDIPNHIEDQIAMPIILPRIRRVINPEGNPF